MIQKYDDISQDIFTYIENYTQYTAEELENLKNKPGSRKVDDSGMKLEFTLQATTDDISFGMWANVAAKMQTIRKVEFDYFKSGLPHQNKSQQLIMRYSWTSFDFISGPENFKKFDDIFQNNGHVFSISAATLGNTWWCFQDSQ